MTASISSSLLAKTRKMVPSAMPAASAISWVVTVSPWARSSGKGGRDDHRAALVGGSAAARLGRTTPAGEATVPLMTTDYTVSESSLKLIFRLGGEP